MSRAKIELSIGYTPVDEHQSLSLEGCCNFLKISKYTSDEVRFEDIQNSKGFDDNDKKFIVAIKDAGDFSKVTDKTDLINSHTKAVKKLVDYLHRNEDILRYLLVASTSTAQQKSSLINTLADNWRSTGTVNELYRYLITSEKCKFENILTSTNYSKFLNLITHFEMDYKPDFGRILSERKKLDKDFLAKRVGTITGLENYTVFV